jgi:hypothetical protein
VIVLLSTSDTDLLSARAMQHTHALPYPKSLERLTVLLSTVDEASLVRVDDRLDAVA